MVKVESRLLQHKKLAKLSERLGSDDARALGVLVRLWMWAQKNRPDGFLDGARTDDYAPGIPLAALIDSGWLDTSPLRIHGWWERYAARMKDYSRKSPAARQRYEQAAERWKSVGCSWDAREAKAATPAAAPQPPEKPAPAAAVTDEKPKPAPVKQLTLTGEVAAPDPRKKSNQQLIVEKFAAVRKLDMSTPAAVKLAFKQNGAAAGQIDKLTCGDIAMALEFVDVASQAKQAQMEEWTKRDGQDHAWTALSAILPLWTEFKAAYEKYCKPLPPLPREAAK